MRLRFKGADGRASDLPFARFVHRIPKSFKYMFPLIALPGKPKPLWWNTPIINTYCRAEKEHLDCDWYDGAVKLLGLEAFRKVWRMEVGMDRMYLSKNLSLKKEHRVKVDSGRDMDCD